MYHRYPPDYRQFDPKLATDRYRSISCLHTAPFAVLPRVVRRRAPLSANKRTRFLRQRRVREILHGVFPNSSLSFPHDPKSSALCWPAEKRLICTVFLRVSTGICRRSSGNFAKIALHSPAVHPTFALKFPNKLKWGIRTLSVRFAHAHGV